MEKEELYTLAKKEIDYDRQVALCGKERADTVLQFWILGFTHNESQILSLQKEKQDLQVDCNNYCLEIEDLKATNTELLDCLSDLRQNYMNATIPEKIFDKIDSLLSKHPKEDVKELTQADKDSIAKQFEEYHNRGSVTVINSEDVNKEAVEKCKHNHTDAIEGIIFCKLCKATLGGGM